MIDDINLDQNGTFLYSSSLWTKDTESMPPSTRMQGRMFYIDLTTRRKADSLLDTKRSVSNSGITAIEASQFPKNSSNQLMSRCVHKQEGVSGYLLGLAEILAGGALIVTGGALEVVSFGTYSVGFAVQIGSGLALIGHGLAKTTAHARQIQKTNPPHVWKNTDVYSPDRPLPRDPRTREPLPDTDAPHTQLGTQNGSQGKYPQAREFDENGAPVRDIDFTDHGRPLIHGNPHEHPYVDNPTGGTKKRDNGREIKDWEN